MTDQPVASPGPGHTVLVSLAGEPVLRLTPQAALDLAIDLVGYAGLRLRAQLVEELSTPLPPRRGAKPKSDPNAVVDAGPVSVAVAEIEEEIVRSRTIADERPVPEFRSGGRRPSFNRCPSCGTPRGLAHDPKCPHREEW